MEGGQEGRKRRGQGTNYSAYKAISHESKKMQDTLMPMIVGWMRTS